MMEIVELIEFVYNIKRVTNGKWCKCGCIDVFKRNKFSISIWHQSKYMLIEWILNRLTAEWVGKSWFLDNWLGWAWVGSDTATAYFLFYVTKLKSIESRYKSKRCKRLKTFLYIDAAKKELYYLVEVKWIACHLFVFFLFTNKAHKQRESHCVSFISKNRAVRLINLLSLIGQSGRDTYTQIVRAYFSSTCLYKWN